MDCPVRVSWGQRCQIFMAQKSLTAMGNVKMEAGRSVKGCWILIQARAGCTVGYRADGDNLNVNLSLGSLAPKLLSVPRAWVLCGIGAGDVGSSHHTYGCDSEMHHHQLPLTSHVFPGARSI